MRTITAKCRSCGIVDQVPENVTVIPLENESEAIFLLDCPNCGQLIVRLTDLRRPTLVELPWWRIMINDLRALLSDSAAPSIYVDHQPEKRESE